MPFYLLYVLQLYLPLTSPLGFTYSLGAWIEAHRTLFEDASGPWSAQPPRHPTLFLEILFLSTGMGH